MDNVFKYIKEFTYDFVGYVVPGIIVFYLLLIVATQGASPIYILFTNKETYKSVLEKLVSINIFAIIVISYLLGHGVNFICNIMNEKVLDFLDNIEKVLKHPIKFLKKILSLIKITLKHPIKYLKITISFFKRLKKSSQHQKLKRDYQEKNKKILEDMLEEKVLYIYREDDILNSLDEKEKSRYLLTLASTNSRFEDHNDLIQKYIYKNKLYGSLSCICLGLLINVLVSIIPIMIVKVDCLGLFFSILLKILLILILLVIMMISFYSECKRHLNLRRKESYMYLINNKSNIKIELEDEYDENKT